MPLSITTLAYPLVGVAVLAPFLVTIVGAPARRVHREPLLHVASYMA